MSSSNSLCSDMSLPSLCIPRVFQNITKERVSFVIQSVGLGEIHHIDMIPRISENGDKFQRVFIHFKEWSKSSSAQRARERVLSGKEIKIVYDEPWFWKLSANRSNKNVRLGTVTPHLIEDDSSSSDNDEKLVSRKQQKPSQNHDGKPYYHNKQTKSNGKMHLDNNKK
uniref:Uncharacterized protein n=1 Tax=viral metagenome TaxID=1070528 RepID=A0A6C0D991_9ZZZZ